jgi:PAS domain S-box-containing protein
MRRRARCCSPFTHPELDQRDSELYRLLVESVVDYAIFALDASGNVATWNKGAQRLKGYSAAEIIGSHFSVFYPEQDVAARKPQRELELAVEQGRVEDEGWRIRKDGSRFWANVVITALRGPTGNVIGFAKVTRDLTARRTFEEREHRLAIQTAQRVAQQELTLELEATNQQLENTLADAEEARQALQAADYRTRFLVELGDALSASLDYETNLRELTRKVVPELADWCVVEMSEAGGVDSRQLAVAHVDPAKVSLAHELRRRYPQRPDADTGVAKVMRTGKPELYPEITDDMLAAAVQDQDHLQLLRVLNLRSAMILPLIARGRTLGTLTLVAAESGRTFGEADLAFAMELARRAALAIDNASLHAEAVEARQAAEHAADVKTRFLAVMSHELRTPLNAIAGYAELLAMGLRGPITQEQKQDLDRITRNQNSLLSLIDDVLDYAKLESGRMTLDVRFVNVRHEVEEIQALIAPQLAAKRLAYDISGCRPEVTVCADPRSLRQILLNLLSNAIKFTDEGGRISLSSSAEGDRASITVFDTGIGIPAEKLGTIFEPFVQLGRDLSHPHKGTGLGLAISRDLAREMRGELTAESNVGEGSAFTLTLPTAADGASCEPSSSRDQSAAARSPVRLASPMRG